MIQRANLTGGLYVLCLIMVATMALRDHAKDDPHLSPAGFIPSPEIGNEPPGFTTAFDLKPSVANGIQNDGWTFVNAKGVADGDVYYAVRDGREVIEFRYPEGQSDAYPGGNGRVTYDEGVLDGPYNYYRFEDVWMDPLFHGHQSGVNKFGFLSFDNERDQNVLSIFGSDLGTLRPTIGTQGDLPDARYSPNYTSARNQNLANYDAGQDEFTRGEYHTMEYLHYRGTAGNTDGWFMFWLDGVLIMHYENVGLMAPGIRNYQGWDFGPIWGGTGDITPQDMFLRTGRIYASYGDSLR